MAPPERRQVEIAALTFIRLPLDLLQGNEQAKHIRDTTGVEDAITDSVTDALFCRHAAGVRKNRVRKEIGTGCARPAYRQYQAQTVMRDGPPAAVVQ